jgi:succinate dehydrogenase / fumarate reductase, cytochrome b subunit
MRRLHSFSGVLPLGIYLIYHLWENWSVVRGREPWVDRVTWLDSHFGFAINILFFLLLAIHAVLGLRPLAQINLPASDLRGIQLVTGVISLFFIVFHAIQLLPATYGPHQSVRNAYAVLWTSLSRPGYLAIYLVGISAVYFHFAHGLSRAVVAWDLISTERALRMTRYTVSVVGLVLWGLTLHVLGHFVVGQGLVE